MYLDAALHSSLTMRVASCDVLLDRAYPLNRSEFRRFLQDRLCEENFEFVTEVHDLRSKSSADAEVSVALQHAEHITQT